MASSEDGKGVEESGENGGVKSEVVEVKRVAVIGAGVSGLVGLKTALEAGQEATCFEQRDDIGGIWHQIDPTEQSEEGLDIGARTYKGMFMNTVKTWYCYSDFPRRKASPWLPRHQDTKAYLDDYAHEFRLRPHIRLNRKVTRLQKAHDYDATGRWTLTTVNAQSQDGEETTTFDAVLLASGYFQKPIWPLFSNQSQFRGAPAYAYSSVDLIRSGRFPGSIIHSANYYSPDRYAGRRVAILGCGLSGVDIASILAPITSQLYIITRSGAYVIPQFLAPGKSWEELFFDRRLNNSLSNSKFHRVWQTAVERRFNHRQLGLKSDHPVYRAGSLAISQDIDQWISTGKLRIIRGDIEGFIPSGIRLKGQEEELEVDDVLLATGFDLAIPYLSEPLLHPQDRSQQEWWNYFYPIHQQHPTLFTLALHYAFGAYTLLAEMQARAAVGVISGQLSLPSMEQMKEDIQKEKKAVVVAKGKFPGAVNGCQYALNNMSHFIGCYPSLLEMAKKDLKLAWRSWRGPVYPAHFRLFGPGAQWQQARQAIMKAQDWAFVGHRMTALDDVVKAGRAEDDHKRAVKERSRLQQ